MSKPEGNDNSGAGGEGTSTGGDDAAKKEAAAKQAEAEKQRQAEIDAEVAKRLQVEKTKIYDTVEAEKKRAEEAEKQLAEYKKKEEEEKAKAEKERLEKLTEEQRLREELEAQKRKLDQVTDGFSALKQETEQTLKKKDLDLFKVNFLKDKKDYIPELVTGNTPEEIEKSFGLSQKRFQELVGPAIKREQKPDPALTQEIPGAGSGGGTGGQGDQGSVKSSDEIMRMTPEEYAAYKDSVLQKHGF